MDLVEFSDCFSSPGDAGPRKIDLPGTRVPDWPAASPWPLEWAALRARGLGTEAINHTTERRRLTLEILLWGKWWERVGTMPSWLDVR